jgi:hypothetical protein
MRPTLYDFEDFFQKFFTTFSGLWSVQGAMLRPQSQVAPVHAVVSQEYSMVPPADNPAHLSVTCAFVVQFRADTAVEQRHLTGRL